VSDPQDPADERRPLAPPDDVPPLSAEELVDGEAAPDAGERRYPSTIGGAFYLLALVVVAAGIWIVVDGSWRVGVRVMGGALLGSALVRLALRSHDAGMLAVRNKWVDALLLVALGAALIFLAGSIPDQPGP
jgi:hypothetical protein